MRYFGIYKNTWWCRWCGEEYKPGKETERDGFCPGGKCKQAHHRAVKKYEESPQGQRYRAAIAAKRSAKDHKKRVTQRRGKK